jgi:hypothetical protein
MRDDASSRVAAGVAHSDDAMRIDDAQRATLDALLDLIVPALPARGLPGASRVGVQARLLGEARALMPGVIAGLAALEAAARATHGMGFAAIDAAQRLALADALRARDPGFLAELALETVTCYYQDPRVLEAIGVEARPPAPQGYQVIAGDLKLLEPVRRRGEIWRRV